MAITLWSDVERGLTNTEFDNNFIELAAGCIAQSVIDNRPLVKPTLNLDFTKGILDSRITFTRNSTATYFGSDGLLKTAGINEPRFEYDPITRQPKGLLIEESRTNLLKYSEQFDNSLWTKTDCNILSNVIVAPNATITGDKIIENVGNVKPQLKANFGATTGRLMVSIYAKAGERSFLQITSWADPTDFQNFDLANGVLGSSGSATLQQYSSITHIGNGWYRCCAYISPSGSGIIGLQIVQSSTAKWNEGYTGDGVSGLYIWAAQSESATFPTSYIPTTSVQVTRSVDAASITGVNFSSLFRQDEGTFLIQGSYSVQNGVTNIQIGLAGNITFDFVSRDARFNVNGTIVSYNTLGSIDATYPFLVAGAYKNNDSASSLNGAVATTNTTATVGTSTSFVIAVNKNGGTIKRIAFYPKRLTNTQLQQLTSTV